MSSALILGIVMLATFGLAALLLAGLVAIAWRAGLNRVRAAAADLLAVRLLPVTGALLLALAVVLPAFLSHEPHRDRETPGPLLLMLAAFALLSLGHGIWRGWRAWRAARSLLLECGPAKRCVIENGCRVQVVDTAKHHDLSALSVEGHRVLLTIGRLNSNPRLPARAVPFERQWVRSEFVELRNIL